MVTKDCEMASMKNQDLGKEVEKETVNMQAKSWTCQWCHGVVRHCYRRFLEIFFVCSLLAWLAILTVLYVKLGHDYGRLRDKFDDNAKLQALTMVNFTKSIQEQTDKKLVNSELSLRRYVNGLPLTKNSTHEETSVKVHELRPQLNTSLEKGREVVDSLISALDKLKANLSSFANSSDSKMRRFRGAIEQLSSRLVLAQKDLTRINASLRTELEEVDDSTDSSVGKVRRELSVFRNATASKIARMTSDLNETNANVVKMLEIFYRQNSSYYSHVHDKTTALVLKMEDMEKRMWNFTATDLRRFRGDLNETKENLRLTRAELLRSNTSVYTLIQGVAETQKASVESMNGTIGGLRKDFDSEKKLGVAQQKTTRDEISKVKAEFQESLKEEKEASSALERKMVRKQTDIETGQRSQGYQISGLQREVNKMQEKVNKAVNNKASVGLSVSTSLFIMGACACFLFV